MAEEEIVKKKLAGLHQLSDVLKGVRLLVENDPLGEDPEDMWAYLADVAKAPVPLRIYETGEAPDPPADGDVVVYARTDRKLYSMDHLGVETLMSGGLGAASNNLFNARLTLTSGTPVTTADVAAATSIHIEPYLGNQARLYDGIGWVLRDVLPATIKLTDNAQAGNTVNGSNVLSGLTSTQNLVVGGAVSAVGIPGGTTVASISSETQIVMSANATADGTEVAVTYTDPASKVIDLFAHANGSNIHYEKAVWTNASTRATALVFQDGVYVKSGDATRRYVGTYYTLAAGQTEDSVANRLVYNHDNKILRRLRNYEGTNHSYTTSSPRLYNNSLTNNQFGLCIGMPTIVRYDANAIVKGNGSTGYGALRPYIDGAWFANNEYVITYSALYESLSAFAYLPCYGYHYINMYEIANAGQYDRMWQYASVMM